MNGKKSPKKRGALRVYNSYMFRDKDPIIDAVRTVRQFKKIGYAAIEESGGPTATTVRNWEKGKTKRPQFSTVWAAIRAMGYGSIKVGDKGYPKIDN